jgi:hypothetical protein
MCEPDLLELPVSLSFLPASGTTTAAVFRIDFDGRDVNYGFGELDEFSVACDASRDVPSLLKPVLLVCTSVCGASSATD